MNDWLDKLISKNAWTVILGLGAVVWWGATITIKLDNIEKTQEAMNKFIQEKYVSEETRYGSLILRVAALETLENVRHGQP